MPPKTSYRKEAKNLRLVNSDYLAKKATYRFYWENARYDLDMETGVGLTKEGAILNFGALQDEVNVSIWSEYGRFQPYDKFRIRAETSRHCMATHPDLSPN